MLTERAKAACRNFVQHFNWRKAMRDAGYSAKTANHNGYKLMQDPDVAAYLKTLMDKTQAKVELTAANVLEELRRLAFSNHIDFYKWSERKKLYVLKAPEELTPDQKAAVKSYTPGKGYELYGKDVALDKLAKYFKLYSEVETIITNFVLMPEVKIGGKKAVFDVGKPAPRREAKKD